jgi:hypothetical protein
MGYGNKGLDSLEYDQYLVKNKKEAELKERQFARKHANKGYEGWHFGLGSHPVYTKDKAEFKRELDKRGLMIKDDVKKNLK